MTTFPNPVPPIEPAEHPRSTKHIHAGSAPSTEPTAPSYAGGPVPGDPMATETRKGGASSVTGKQPEEPGLPEMPTAPNTNAGAK